MARCRISNSGCEAAYELDGCIPQALQGLWVWGLGVRGLGFRVWGLGFRV